MNIDWSVIEEDPEPEPPEDVGTMLTRIGTDALLWSQEFCAHVLTLDADGHLGIDLDAVVGWFANALQAGQTFGQQLMCIHPYDQLYFLDSMTLCNTCGKAFQPAGPPPPPP